MRTTRQVPGYGTDFDNLYEKWIEIDLSSEPADFDLAIETALKGYELANLNKPTLILRMGSPLGVLAAGVLSELCLQELEKIQTEQLSADVLNHVWEQVSSQVGDKVSQQVWTQIREQIKSQVENQVWSRVGEQASTHVCDHRDPYYALALRYGEWGPCCQEASAASTQISDHVLDQLYANPLFYGYGDRVWVSFCPFFSDIVAGSWFDPSFELLLVVETLAKTCGFAWFKKDVLVISDRPQQIHRDAAGRLHRMGGPSISFRDGWSVFHWHGVPVPGEWVTGSPPSAAEALTWENLEQRRAVCEIIGWKRILEELDVKAIDEDYDPEIGTLLEADIPDSGKERFLKVRCGTGREFVLSVPRHVETALEANAWTWGLKSRQYRPEVRT